MDLTYLRPQNESFAPTLYTWRDLLVDLMDSGGIHATGADERRLRTATLDAYRDLYHKRDWKFANKQYTFRTSAAVEVVGYYDHTGGTSERLFTVTSGTLPTWLRDATAIIDSIPYEPDEAVSTNFTLTLRNNPGEDVGSVGSPVTIKLIRSIYPMPADYIRPYEPEAEVTGTLDWTDWQDLNARGMDYVQYGEPRYCAAAIHPKLLGTSCLRVWPYASTSRVVSMLYRGSGRPLRYAGFTGCTGTFTLNTGTDANRCTLSGVTVSSKMIGSVFRLRSDTNTPENIDGQYPYDEQATIIAVDVSNSYVYLDRDMTSSYTAKAFVISDPIDLPPYALSALKALCRLTYFVNSNREQRDVQLAGSVLQEQWATLMENDRSPRMSNRLCWNFQDYDSMSEDWVT